MRRQMTFEINLGEIIKSIYAERDFFIIGKTVVGNSIEGTNSSEED